LLSGTTVIGDSTVAGWLNANGVNFTAGNGQGGNFVGTKAAEITIQNSEIAGSFSDSNDQGLLTLDHAKLDSSAVISAAYGGDVFIGDGSIAGSLAIAGSQTPVVVSGETIGTSADVSGSTSRVTFTSVKFGTSLSCEGNTKSPSDGGGNRFGGPPQGQCAGFGKPLPGVISLSRAPTFTGSALKLTVACSATPAGGCSASIHAVLTVAGRRADLGNRPVSLQPSASHTLTFKLAPKWRKLLAQHPGHLTVTAGGESVYDGRV
jgi:hypothetical protein